MKRINKKNIGIKEDKTGGPVNIYTPGKLGLYLSRILTVGILTSLFFIALGLIFALIDKVPYSEYILKNIDFSFTDIFMGIASFSAGSYFYFAIFILILTSFATILFCIFHFLKRKLYRHMSVSIGVLFILAVSIIAGFLNK